MTLLMPEGQVRAVKLCPPSCIQLNGPSYEPLARFYGAARTDCVADLCASILSTRRDPLSPLFLRLKSQLAAYMHQLLRK